MNAQQLAAIVPLIVVAAVASLELRTLHRNPKVHELWVVASHIHEIRRSLRSVGSAWLGVCRYRRDGRRFGFGQSRRWQGFFFGALQLGSQSVTGVLCENEACFQLSGGGVDSENKPNHSQESHARGE